MQGGYRTLVRGRIPLGALTGGVLAGALWRLLVVDRQLVGTAGTAEQPASR